MYFFQWIMEQDPKWVDNHIYAYFAIAPAFLGSAKSLRTVVPFAESCHSHKIFSYPVIRWD